MCENSYSTFIISRGGQKAILCSRVFVVMLALPCPLLLNNIFQTLHYEHIQERELCVLLIDDGTSQRARQTLSASFPHLNLQNEIRPFESLPVTMVAQKSLNFKRYTRARANTRCIASAFATTTITRTTPGGAESSFLAEKCRSLTLMMMLMLQT